MTNTKELAKEIARQMRKGELAISPADIALMCDYEPDSTPVRQMLADPTFPPAISLVPGGHKRYRKQDVVDWINRKFEAESRLTMSIYRV